MDPREADDKTPNWSPGLDVTEAQLEERGRRLVEALALAEALPVRHESELRFPRLVQRAG